jgi:Mn-dependent DtxR family transcriptional regulator
MAEARRVVRNHRLWETYLIRYADVATARVDHEADEIEHVLGAELVAELERAVREESGKNAIPPSPHELSAHGQKTAAGERS